MGRALLAPAAEAEYKRVAVKEGSLALVSNDEISTAETVHSPVLESSAPKNVKKKASGDVKANLKTATKKRSAPHEVYRPKKIDASGKRVKPPVVKPKAVVNPKPASNSNSKSKRILVSSDDEDDLVETKKSKVIEYVESPDPIRTSTRFGRSISKPVEWWKA